jgi:alcohol dehydrogenase class-P
LLLRSLYQIFKEIYCCLKGWGVAVLVGVPSKDDAFKTHPINLLDERTLKGTTYGNYKPRTDLPNVVEKYMKGVSLYILVYYIVQHF